MNLRNWFVRGMAMPFQSPCGLLALLHSTRVSTALSQPDSGSATLYLTLNFCPVLHTYDHLARVRVVEVQFLALLWCLVVRYI